MEKYRIVKLSNGNYRLEHFETNWLLNPFRLWGNYDPQGSPRLETAEDAYNWAIERRERKLKPTPFVQEVVKEEL